MLKFNTYINENPMRNDIFEMNYHAFVTKNWSGCYSQLDLRGGTEILSILEGTPSNLIIDLTEEERALLRIDKP